MSSVTDGPSAAPDPRPDDPTGPDGADAPAEEGAAGADALEALRARIIEVDGELVRLVGERRALVLAIGEAKKELGRPVMDPAREAAVVRRAAQRAREAGIDEEMVRDVIWRIIASARDAQEARSSWGPPDFARPPEPPDGGDEAEDRDEPTGGSTAP